MNNIYIYLFIVGIALYLLIFILAVLSKPQENRNYMPYKRAKAMALFSIIMVLPYVLTFF